MNHFLYENFCNSKNFIHFDKELKKFDSAIKENTNVLLYSKRRYGKVSLIKEYISERIDKDKTLSIYIDLFNISSAIDFAKLIYKKIASSIYCDNNLILRELKMIFVKANFTATMNENGLLEFDVSLISYNPEELIADIFKGLKKINNNTKKQILLIFNDFWQIKHIKNSKIDSILKTYIQDEQHINYVFTGTKYHMLLEMFSKRKMPLFNLAVPFELKAIPIDQFYEFIKLKTNNKIKYNIFELIYHKADGEPKLIQEFCYHLCNMFHNKEEFTLNDVEEVCLFFQKSKSEYFKIILNRLTMIQKTALKAVILSQGTELYTKANLFKLQITKASLNTAIKSLLNDELIDKVENKYIISNKCFELWCKRVL